LKNSWGEKNKNARNVTERERKETFVLLLQAESHRPETSVLTKSREHEKGGREVGTRRIINFRQFCDAVKLAITHKKI
jgi:hypothetical protein